MPNDLWYFYESDLDKGSLESFHESLPDHLKKKFVDSIGGFKIFDRNSGNVLQGYRGPHTNGGSGDSAYLGACNGLQEVRYWWGVTKHLLWTPISAPGYVFGRAVMDTDWHSLYFDSETGECLSHKKNKAAEKLKKKKAAEKLKKKEAAEKLNRDKDAEKFNIPLFQERNYVVTAQYHYKPYQAYFSDYENEHYRPYQAYFSDYENEHYRPYQAYFSGYENEREFENYRYRSEVEAMHLKSLGDRLFSEGEYSEALEKYHEANDESPIYDKYRANIEKVQAEIDALNLNSEGEVLFSQSRYTEALGKFQEARWKSEVKKELNKYWSNQMRAQAEIDAINLNCEGEVLFFQSRYAEALRKYQEAHDKSQISKERNKYRDNKEKAQAELAAITLNSEGDNLFRERKYGEALRKYQAAYDKSLVKKEKNKYALSTNNVQALKDRLTTLETLWEEAWEAENDTANDRSGEAEELFQRVLSKTRDSLNLFPCNLRFKQYEILVSLKIEGNKSFNEGLEAQQDGSKLFREAKELKLQQQFESALMKYKEAKSKFSQAQEKFKAGREKDVRFVSCIDFVQDQLDKVLQSIEAIEQHALSSTLLNLNISISESSSRFKAESSQGNITGDHNNYYEQI